MKKSEVKRYIAVVDYLTEYKDGYCYKELQSENIIGAMNEASELKDENVYLVSIFEKVDSDKDKIYYSRILTKRSCGWHTNKEGGEVEETIAFYYKIHDKNEKIDELDFEFVGFKYGK